MLKHKLQRQTIQKASSGMETKKTSTNIDSLIVEIDALPPRQSDSGEL